MDQKPEWMDKYRTPEHRQQLRDLAKASYSTETLQKLVHQGWTEQDHLQQVQRYGAFRAELKRLTEAGVDPAGPEA